jgi:hypothetical protein
MFSLKYFRCKTISFLALLIGATTVAPVISFNPANAGPLFRSQGSSTSYDQSILPAGTQIPVEFEKEKILVTKEETVPVTLKVAANLKTSGGAILVPYGTQIVVMSLNLLVLKQLMAVLKPQLQLLLVEVVRSLLPKN